jgi:hypothetical protein
MRLGLAALREQLVDSGSERRIAMPSSNGKKGLA